MADERRNSFDVLRLLAAAFVFFGHQIGLAGFSGISFGPASISLESTGLYIFFGLSGYLVFKSVDRDPRSTRYFAARALRIYPAAIVNALLCTIAGACITTSTFSEYFSSFQTWTYLATNASIIIVPTQFQLPGVFDNAQWPAVNGSIWTIKYELLCYIGLFCVYRISKPFKSHSLPICAILLCLIYFYVLEISWRKPPSDINFFATYNSFNLARFFMTFCFGAFLASTEPRSQHMNLLALALPAALIAFGPSPELWRAGVILLLTLFMVELGKSPGLYSASYRSLGDLSYGLFLYAYPIQNYVMVTHYNGANFLNLTCISLLITVGCAYASWRLVERPFIRLKS